MNQRNLVETVVRACLVRARDTIPFFPQEYDLNGIVLYGAPGAVLDSLNLVAFVFLIEEEVTRQLKLAIEITTDDVLGANQNPFSSAACLREFLEAKLFPTQAASGP